MEDINNGGGTPPENGTKPEENKVAELESKHADLTQKYNELLQIQRNLVQELKELRQKKGEDIKSKPDVSEDEIGQKVLSILDEQKRKDAEGNFEKAKSIFFEKNKEFHPDNDVSGIKFNAIQNELNGFNLSTVYSVEDYSKLFNKALALINQNSHSPSRVVLDAGEPKVTPEPKGQSPSKLTAKEQSIVKKFGWTEDRYLKLKEKNPAYIKDLITSYKTDENQ